MKDLQIAVVGGGKLGSIHAKLLRQVPETKLCAIVEPSETRAAELRQTASCDIITDVDRFVQTTKVDGVVLAAPTTLHHDLGTRLLSRGVHCLIEKPLASSLNECRELVNTASQSNAILQVGHVERFNPAWTTMCTSIGEPRFIQAAREAPLTFRSLDAGVVMDLMVHDIDLVLSIVKSPVATVQAWGVHWTGPTDDLAHARVTFANGCVAVFSASRISTDAKREMRIVGRDWYSEIDFGARKCHVVDAPATSDWQSRRYTDAERTALMEAVFSDVTPKTELEVPEANPILDELVDFTTSIRTHSQPIVPGEAGMRAVDLASQVVQQLSRPGIAPSYIPTRRKAG